MRLRYLLSRIFLKCAEQKESISEPITAFRKSIRDFNNLCDTTKDGFFEDSANLLNIITPLYTKHKNTPLAFLCALAQCSETRINESLFKSARAIVDAYLRLPKEFSSIAQDQLPSPKMVFESYAQDVATRIETKRMLDKLAQTMTLTS